MDSSGIYAAWWEIYSQAEINWSLVAEYQKQGDARKAAEATILAQQQTRQAETLRNRLWEQLEETVTMLTRVRHGAGNNPGVSDSGYDLLAQGFQKFVEVLPKLHRYDLSHPQAVERIVLKAIRNHFTDLCFPERRRKAEAPRYTPANALSLDSLSIDLPGGVMPQASAPREVSPEEIRDAIQETLVQLQQEVKTPKQREIMEKRVAVVRIMLLQPEAKMGEIAAVLQMSNAWVTTAKTSLFPRMAALIRSNHPHIAEWLGLPIEEPPPESHLS